MNITVYCRLWTEICLNFLIALVSGTCSWCSGPVRRGGSQEQETASANQQTGRTGHQSHWEVQSHRRGVFVIMFRFSCVLFPVQMGLMMLSNLSCSVRSDTPCWKKRIICRRESVPWNSSWKMTRERWVVSLEWFRCLTPCHMGSQTFSCWHPPWRNNDLKLAAQ